MNTTPSSPLHFTSTTASDRPRSDKDQPQIDATRRVRAGERALVLPGGGSAGNGGGSGAVPRLVDAGLDGPRPPRLNRRSAGSTAGDPVPRVASPHRVPP